MVSNSAGSDPLPTLSKRCSDYLVRKSRNCRVEIRYILSMWVVRHKEQALTGLAIPCRRRASWRRHVLGTFLLAWFAMVAQPCAMAAHVESDCPHCPSTETHDSRSCDDTITPDCALDYQLNSDSRSTQNKVKDSPNQLPVAIAPVPCAIARPALLTRSLPHSSVFLDPSGPPRNILFCVYLK
jgi:hypothetical protein